MPTNHLIPNTCDNCGEAVAVRRPSKTGKHFCSRKDECQAAKQKFYRQLRTSPDQDVEEARLSLLFAAANRERIRCHQCGLENAVPGWAHRSAPGSNKPCLALGSGGAIVGAAWLDAVHPEWAPR